MSVKHWLTSIAIAVGLSTLPACGTTTLGETLGVSVVASGPSIDVSWSELHGWNSVMSQRGLRLIAEYPAATSGLVREQVALGRLTGVRQMSFALPASLRSNPTGSVCLYLSVAGTDRIVPIRKAGPQREDTGRFRYAEWESQAVAATQNSTARADTVALVRHKEELARIRDSKLEAMKARGWVTQASCEAVSPDKFTANRPPAGVLATERHDAAARQACVNQAANARGHSQRLTGVYIAERNVDALKSASSLASLLPSAAEALLQMKAQGNATFVQVLNRRQREARTVLNDWKAFSATVGKAYTPPIGTKADYLTLVATAQSAHARFIIQENASQLPQGVVNQATLSAGDLVGMFGSMLDSYLGCVDDGKRQLQTALTAWNDIQRDSPERTRRIQQYFAAECRSQWQLIAKLDADIANVNASADVASGSQAALGGVQTAMDGISAKSLNDQRCR